MLKNNIANKIADNESYLKSNRVGMELKISEFSRAAGISEETLSQILRGNTKNPGVYTIAKIADALNCALDELIADSSADQKTELEIKLARSCIATTVDLLRIKKQQISFDEFLFVIKEIYLDSLNKKATAIDKKFALLYINNFLKSKDVKG